MVKHLPGNAGDITDVGSTPGSGRSPGGGHGNPLQYSCLENPMDSGAWWAIVHGATKSQTRLSDFTSLIIYILLQSGTFVTTDEPILTHHYHSSPEFTLWFILGLYVLWA